MKEKLIETIELKNGMKLNFYDASRRLAGDRWLISLIIRMEIPVVKALINDEGESYAPASAGPASTDYAPGDGTTGHASRDRW